MSAIHRMGVAAGRRLEEADETARVTCRVFRRSRLLLVCGRSCNSERRCVEDERKRSRAGGEGSMTACVVYLVMLCAPEGSILSRRCYKPPPARLVPSLPSQSWGRHISVVSIWVLQFECHAVEPSSSWAPER